MSASAPKQPAAVIVIGASAGGLEPLLEIVANLPADLPAAIGVVIHFPATATSVLPQLLARRGPLPAQHARGSQPLQPGCIYVAPPGEHLLIEAGLAVATRGPRENGYRPAIDALFRTAARAYGPRVIGVVLSGTLDDGALGLQVIQAYGGHTIVQDPHDALFNAMPVNAIAAVTPHHVLPARAIAPQLTRLARQLAQLSEADYAALKEAAMRDTIPVLPGDNEAELVRQDKAVLETNGRHGEPSMLTCPDCGGVLWEVGEGGLLRFRCHVGHAYSADGLRAEQSTMLEGALWAAVRALEESASLARRLAHRARQANNLRTAALFEARAVEDEQRADLVRQALNFSAAPPDSEVNALDSGSGTGG